jgi:hypothetical protein
MLPFSSNPVFSTLIWLNTISGNEDYHYSSIRCTSGKYLTHTSFTERRDRNYENRRGDEDDNEFEERPLDHIESDYWGEK